MLSGYSWELRSAPRGAAGSNVLSTSTSELVLTAGVWEIWATQNFKLTLNRTAGQALSTPTATWPSNTLFEVVVAGSSTRYLSHAALGASGAIYATRIASPLTQTDMQ